MHTETIRTERLVLRRLREEDALPLHRNCSSDPETVRFLTRQAVSDPQITSALVADWIRSYGQEDFFLWAVEFDGEVIGTVNLHDVDRTKGSCEIGFSIGSRWWGKGIMTESVCAVIGQAFSSLGFERIVGWCAEGNAASARVMEKAGMRHTGVERQSVMLSGGSVSDRVWYAVCREEWKQEGFR